MGIFALILGILGGVCAILGVVTASGALFPLGPAYTWEFWLTLGGVIFLASIACSIGRSGEYE